MTNLKGRVGIFGLMVALTLETTKTIRKMAMVSFRGRLVTSMRGIGKMVTSMEKVDLQTLMGKSELAFGNREGSRIGLRVMANL